MKRKIAKRVCSLALCVVFTGMLFGVPKAKAVVTEISIGTSAVAGYMTATGVPLTVINGTAATVSSGVASMAGSYATATGAATSGSAWLSSLAAGVSISPAGAIVLTAAAVVAIGAFVAWYINENNLAASGDTAVAVPGTADRYLYGGVDLPAIPESVEVNGTVYTPHILSFYASKYYVFYQNSFSVSVLNDRDVVISYDAYYIRCDPESASEWSSPKKWGASGQVFSPERILFSSVDIINSDGEVVVSASAPVPVGDVSDQLEVVRKPEFTQPDIGLDSSSATEMVIDVGLPAGTTLETAVEDIPAKIAEGTLEATYEMTEAGEGTEPDEDAGIYIPILSDIKAGIDGLADAITDGLSSALESLFVPSEAYLETLPQQITDTFEERTGFLTYPFSLLPEFVERLSATSEDWIISWPQIVEPFTDTVLFQRGSFNVTSFIQSNAEFKMLYELWRLIAKVLMSFGFIGLCYSKYLSVVGDDYGGS